MLWVEDSDATETVIEICDMCHCEDSSLGDIQFRNGKQICWMCYLQTEEG